MNLETIIEMERFVKAHFNIIAIITNLLFNILTII